jgi:hypothetical protein
MRRLERGLSPRTHREAEQGGAEADGELGDVDVLQARREEVAALVYCP